MGFRAKFHGTVTKVVLPDAPAELGRKGRGKIASFGSSLGLCALFHCRTGMPAVCD